MKLELSSEVLQFHSKDGKATLQDFENLEVLITKVFSKLERVHLDATEGDLGVYQVYMHIDTETTNLQWAVDLLKYSVDQLKNLMAAWEFYLD